MGREGVIVCKKVIPTTFDFEFEGKKCSLKYLLIKHDEEENRDAV